ncbi:MAG: signal peptide peptidase SppA [Burkholderiaceae bacterium]|jgi:protease-4|nr:signal peptide peptidase SppA [Burkholderiaceae bacterium]
MEPINSDTPGQPVKAPEGGSTWERDALTRILDSSVKEQKAKRRWGIFFRLTWLLVFVLAFVSFRFSSFPGTGSTGTEGSAPARPHVAIIKINGVIQSDGRVSADSVVKALRRAFSEKMVTGVILRINSPGGSPVQAGRIYDEVMRLKQKHPDKPVHVVVDEVCASGGYYIAAAAQNIYVDKASVVGSIGVMISGFGFTGLMDKVGVERRLLTSGKNKGFLDAFSVQTPEQKRHAQNLIDEVHQQFISVVKMGRGDRLKESDELFSGLVWTGEKAIELGLADGTGTVDSVAKTVLKTDYAVDYTEEERLADRVLRKLGASAGEAAIRYGTHALVPTWD